MPTTLPPFAIRRPESLQEAAALLRDSGDDARAYAGGTELLLAMKHAGLRYRELVDLKGIPGLDRVARQAGSLEIGALVTHRSLLRSEVVRADLPALAELEAKVANPRVRAIGTLGGNLCFAEPHSDPATLLLCLEAVAHVAGAEGDRDIPLREFFVAPYEVALGLGEILRSISIPLAPARQRAVYQKLQFHERPAIGLALVVALDEEGTSVLDARVAVGSVSPTPRLCAGAEALLCGPLGGAPRRLDDAAAAIADGADLQDGPDGSVEYQRQLIRVLLRRAWRAATHDPAQQAVA